MTTQSAPPAPSGVNREELAEALRSLLTMTIAMEVETEDPAIERAQSLLAQYDNEGGA